MQTLAEFQQFNDGATEADFRKWVNPNGTPTRQSILAFYTEILGKDPSLNKTSIDPGDHGVVSSQIDGWLSHSEKVNRDNPNDGLWQGIRDNFVTIADRDLGREGRTDYDLRAVYETDKISWRKEGLSSDKATTIGNLLGGTQADWYPHTIDNTGDENGQGDVTIQPIIEGGDNVLDTNWSRDRGKEFIRNWYRNNVKGGEGVTEDDVNFWANTISSDPNFTWDTSGNLLDDLTAAMKTAAAKWGNLIDDDYAKANDKFQEVFEVQQLDRSDWLEWKNKGFTVDTLKDGLRNHSSYGNAFRGLKADSTGSYITDQVENTFSLTHTERKTDYAKNRTDKITTFKNGKTVSGYENLTGNRVFHFNKINPIYNDLLGRDIDVSTTASIANLDHWSRPEFDWTRPDLLKNAIRGTQEWKDLANNKYPDRTLPEGEFMEALSKGYFPQEHAGTAAYDRAATTRTFSANDADLFRDNDYMLYHYKELGITPDDLNTWIDMEGQIESFLGITDTNPEGTAVTHFGTHIKKKTSGIIPGESTDLEIMQRVLAGDIDWAFYRNSNEYKEAWKSLVGTEGWDTAKGTDAYIGITSVDEINKLNEVSGMAEAIQAAGEADWATTGGPGTGGTSTKGTWTGSLDGVEGLDWEWKDGKKVQLPQPYHQTADYIATTNQKYKVTSGDYHVSGEEPIYGIDLNHEANLRFYKNYENFGEERYEPKALDSKDEQKDIADWVVKNDYTISGEGVGWSPPEWTPKENFKIPTPNTTIKDPGNLPTSLTAEQKVKATKIKTLKSKTTGAER